MMSSPFGITLPPTRPVADLVVDLAKQPFNPGLIVAHLVEYGVVVIRNLFPTDQMQDIARRADDILLKPAIAGTIGYSKVDHPKRIANPMLIGAPLVRAVTDIRIIEIAEHLMGSECVLAEAILKRDEPVGYAYFPIHSDFSVGWKKSNVMNITLSEEDIKLPIGMGGVFYLHDTESGHSAIASAPTSLCRRKVSAWISTPWRSVRRSCRNVSGSMDGPATSFYSTIVDFMARTNRRGLGARSYCLTTIVSTHSGSCRFRRFSSTHQI